MTADSGLVVNLVTKFRTYAQEVFLKPQIARTVYDSSTYSKTKMVHKNWEWRWTRANWLGPGGYHQWDDEGRVSTLWESVSASSLPRPFCRWQYTDKAKRCKTIGPLTPLEFYNFQLVKPVYDLEDKIWFVGSDPRPPTRQADDRWTALATWWGQAGLHQPIRTLH